MKQQIPTILVVEDILSEMVLRKMLASFPKKFSVRNCLGKEGFGFIQKNMPAFNKAASTIGIVVLTDLDNNLCPRLILNRWLPQVERHPQLLFRVAIYEVEAWLLSHRDALARYFRIALDLIPENSESVQDPKALIIELADQSPRKEIREAIVPGPGRRRKVGPDYNGCLLYFVHHYWEVEKARPHSRSLHRAMVALARYRFVVPSASAHSARAVQHQ